MWRREDGLNQVSPAVTLYRDDRKRPKKTPAWLGLPHTAISDPIVPAQGDNLVALSRSSGPGIGNGGKIRCTHTQWIFPSHSWEASSHGLSSLSSSHLSDFISQREKPPVRAKAPLIMDNEPSRGRAHSSKALERERAQVRVLGKYHPNPPPTEIG